MQAYSTSCMRYVVQYCSWGGYGAAACLTACSINHELVEGGEGSTNNKKKVRTRREAPSERTSLPFASTAPTVQLLYSYQSR